LNVKLFPDHWKTDSVSALCTDVVDCVNKTAPVVDGPTEYKMIRTTNVKAGRINLDDCRYVDEPTFVKWTRRIQPKRGDIVLTREAPLGEVGLLRSDESVFLGQRTMLYRADPKKLDQRFLYYSMLGPFVQGQIRSQGSGATVEHLRVPDAESFLVAFPPLDEQRRIAALLSAYDDLIANNQHRIALLESMAEEIYREWFLRMRFPRHDEVQKTKGMPEGWTPATLGAIASFVMGQSPSSEHYNETGDGLPFHQGVGTYGDRFPRHQVFCSSIGRKANAGDILFSVRAPVGRLNIADTELIIGRGLAAIRHKQDLNSYFFYLLKVTFANEDMIGNGSIFNSVGKDELAKQPILCPPPELMEMFETLIKPIDTQLATLYRTTNKLSKQRDALLPRLISGKLRVEALDIQFPPSMRQPPAEAAQPAAMSG
jgi:type I restriction enzyme S subunit